MEQNLISEKMILNALPKGHNVKHVTFWLSVPCVCKPCALSKGMMSESTYFFYNNDNDTQGGIICVKHGLLGFHAD